MSYIQCSICLEGLDDHPFGDPVNGTQVSVLRTCGHIMHYLCLSNLRAENQIRRRPQCTIQFLEADVHQVFPAVAPTPPCQMCAQNDHQINQLQLALGNNDAEHRNEVTQMQMEIENLTARLQRLTIGDRVAPLGFGVRFHLLRNFNDSACVNCESLHHNSRRCPNPPILRFKEQTSYERWAPIQDFQATAVLDNENQTAAEIINYYCSRFKVRNPSRAQVQVMFGFVFFDNCCWKCGSPFHHRLDSKNEDQNVKGFAKLLHEHNHPLTAQQAEQRRRFQTPRQ